MGLPARGLQLRGFLPKLLEKAHVPCLVVMIPAASGRREARPQLCRPRSSGSSVETLITLTGSPLALRQA